MLPFSLDGIIGRFFLRHLVLKNAGPFCDNVISTSEVRSAAMLVL
jgi:hypothetical protein